MGKKIFFAACFILGLKQMGVAIPGAKLFSANQGIDAISNTGATIKRHTPYEVDYTELANSELDEYAQDGSFTILTFHSNTCSICKELQKGYLQLQQKRPDLKVVEITLPDSFESSGINSQSEMENKLKQMTDIFDKFNVCGTPNVVIFDTKSKVVASDSCRDREGTNYLIKWLKAESISVDL